MGLGVWNLQGEYGIASKRNAHLNPNRECTDKDITGHQEVCDQVCDDAAGWECAGVLPSSMPSWGADEPGRLFLHLHPYTVKGQV